MSVGVEQIPDWKKPEGSDVGMFRHPHTLLARKCEVSLDGKAWKARYVVLVQTSILICNETAAVTRSLPYTGMCSISCREGVMQIDNQERQSLFVQHHKNTPEHLNVRDISTALIALVPQLSVPQVATTVESNAVQEDDKWDLFDGQHISEEPKFANETECSIDCGEKEEVMVINCDQIPDWKKPEGSDVGVFRHPHTLLARNCEVSLDGRAWKARYVVLVQTSILICNDTAAVARTVPYGGIVSATCEGGIVKIVTDSDPQILVRHHKKTPAHLDVRDILTALFALVPQLSAPQETTAIEDNDDEDTFESLNKLQLAFGPRWKKFVEELKKANTTLNVQQGGDKPFYLRLLAEFDFKASESSSFADALVQYFSETSFVQNEMPTQQENEIPDDPFQSYFTQQQITTTEEEDDADPFASPLEKKLSFTASFHLVASPKHSQQHRNPVSLLDGIPSLPEVPPNYYSDDDL